VAPSPKPAVSVLKVNGWTILCHPLFLDQVAVTVADVQRTKNKDAAAYKKNCTKRLGAVLKLAFADIPSNPASPTY